MLIILTILTLISVIPSSTLTDSKNHVMTEMLLDDLRLNDYGKYNVRSWPTLISSNKFREQLIYNAEDYMGLLLDDSLRCYNGNAAMSIWRSPDQPWPRCYLYHYDALNRLTAADYSDGYALSNHLGGYSTAYSYDRHGNLTAMQRHGQMDNGNFGLIDNLTFTYDGNQLRKVTDAAGSPTYTGVMDFTDGANSTAEYLYDSNGNATCDLNRGISSITYNLLSLPSQITFSTGAAIQYTYNADGRKLNVTHSPPPLSSSGQTTTEYCYNVIYKDGAVERILTNEGYISPSASGIPTYHYFLRDHLGSVNVVLDSSGTVEETTHYYPYGTTFPQTSVQPYKFCGKELDRVHGLDWYDSQARMYDPVLARWHTQDSKAEDYYNWSPYAYCMGNPVNAIDPDGNSVWTKLAKASVKIGKQVAKHGAKALTEGATYAQAVADITDDISTLTDSEASTGSKVWAGISLASEALPLSVNDVKDVGKVAKRVKTAKEEQKASRFIVDLNNNVVDLHKTPIGSYKQPNGDRTDILQNKPHFNKKRKRNDGYSHTHPLELHEDFSGNNHPKYSRDTHQPTFDEIMNIINGRAIPIY